MRCMGTTAGFPAEPRSGAATRAWRRRFLRACPPEARRVFVDRPALWGDHLFEPFLEWVNDNLAKAKWLELHGDPGFATWARLLPKDNSAEQLQGGGYMLNFSALTDKSRPARVIGLRSFCLSHLMSEPFSCRNQRPILS